MSAHSVHQMFVERAKQFIGAVAPEGINPHAVRHIVATTYVSLTGDVYGAAILLQDSPEMLMKAYRHLTDRDRQRAVGFMTSAWEGRLEEWARAETQHAIEARRAF